jgi:peptidyl-prolyl cis-trans isomerase A (cyclophilin A)
MTRQPGTYAVFDTTEGKIVCRLFEKEAPITTKNFTDLAEGKRS